MKDKRKISRRKVDTLPLLLQNSLNRFEKKIMERIDKQEAMFNTRMDAQDEANKPVRDAFTGLNWSKTALIWIVSLIGSITAIILAVKEIRK